MIKVTIGEDIYEYPESMDELKFGQWEELEAIRHNQIDNGKSYDAVLDILDNLTGIPRKILWEKAPKELFHEVHNSCLWYFNFNTEGITPSRSFFIDGVEFTYSDDPVIPMAEWVDRDGVLESYPQVDKFSAMMAIHVRPRGEEYNYKLLKERMELFKKQPASLFVPLIGFFLLIEKQLQTSFQGYSIMMAIATYNQWNLNNSLRNGDGIKSLFNWRTKTLQKLMPFYDTQLLNASTFYHTVKTKMSQNQII